MSDHPQTGNTTGRRIYLDMKSRAAAKQLLFSEFSHLTPISATERLSTPQALDRVLAAAVWSKRSSPNYHGAAMDGFAVAAVDTFGASETTPRTLAIGKEAFAVNTGGPLPPETNAVIMIEDVQVSDEGHISIEQPVSPWQHVRKVGEDIVATELLFPRHHKITPYCIGALLGGGVFEVEVRCRPKVLVMPTGSEVVDWNQPDFKDLSPGQVVDTNSYVLGALIEQWGGCYERHPIVKDDPALLGAALTKAVGQDFDMILTVGGSSAGARDFTYGVVGDLGEILVHGVTMMPGKPVVIGKIKNKPVIGMPGYPVSAIVAFEQLVGPLICRMLGVSEPERPRHKVLPTRPMPSKLGTEEFLRVKLGRVNEHMVATALPRGAGSITSITEADGIIRIPENKEGIDAGTLVEAELLRGPSAIENTLVIVGSHDNSIDLLADQIRANDDIMPLHLSSSHVGSMGGLMAIKRGVCHMAGAHLLDTGDGSYNTSYIRCYLPDIPVCQIHLVARDQGLMVPGGNPFHLESLEDLARNDIRFINRQGGSGTRILLDYQLQRRGIQPEQINGYTHEEFTHMAIAVAVASGIADAGLGIRAAATALGLDFIPVATEDYELIVPRKYMLLPGIETLLATINSETFKQSVLALGGYHTERTGNVRCPS